MRQTGSRPSDLLQVWQAAVRGIRRLPGAERVSQVADGALERIGVVSPRSRRMAVYAGAGVLGAAGVVEWPVALTGAAVAWLTQAHPVPGAQQETARARGHQGGRADTRRSDARSTPATGGSGPGPASDAASRYDAGGRLAPGHSHHDRPERHVHEQPAKVGDPATASALKKVAEASAHHGTPT